MDSIHGLNPWTQSMHSIHGFNPWTQFKESISNLLNLFLDSVDLELSNTLFSIFFAIFCNSRKALKSYVLFQNFILLDFHNFQDFPRFSDFLNVFQILKDFFNSQSIWRIYSFEIFQSFRHLNFKSFSSFIFPLLLFFISFTFLNS